MSSDRFSLTDFRSLGFTAFILAWATVAMFGAGVRNSLSAHSALDQLAIFLSLALFLGFTSWAIFANRRSARILGLAASVLPLLGLTALLVIAHLKSSGIKLHRMPWVAVLVAIGGIVAFLPRRSVPSPAMNEPAGTVLSGDGTLPWINKSIWIVGAVIIFYASDKWVRWAHWHNMPTGSFLSLWGWLILAELTFIFIHELGHAVAGLLLGMRLRAFVAGPFQWRLYEGKWGFKFKPAALLSSGGATSVVPTDPNQPRWHFICMAAAGPAASLITGAWVLWLMLRLPGTRFGGEWPFFACYATLSLAVGILNLVPFKTGETYSDGAYIYQHLAGGPWADYHRVLSMVASSLATPLRPRDFDIDAINRASLVINKGIRAMLLQLFACCYYMDNEQFTLAANASKMVESICGESVPNVPAELQTTLVFNEAFLQHDAAETRLWWNRLEAKDPTRLNVDYWLARAALNWIEGNSAEALSAWEKANSAAEILPVAGAYEFDRHRCKLLRKAIELSPAAVSSETRATEPAI